MLISSDYIVNFDVIPIPPIVDLVPSALMVPLPDLDGLEYKILGLESANIEIFKGEKIVFPKNIPLFGKKKMSAGAEVDLSGTVKGDGTVEIFSFALDAKKKKYIREGIPCIKGIKLPYVEMGPEFGLDMGFKYIPSLENWKPDGSVSLGVNKTLAGPAVPLSLLTGIPILQFLFVKGEFSIDLKVEGSIEDWDPNGPKYQAAFIFEPLVKLILGAGKDKVATAEVYGGGGIHGEIILYPIEDAENLYCVVLVGYRLTAGPFTIAEGEKQWKYPEQESLNILLNESLRNPNAYLLSRDYLDYPVSFLLNTSELSHFL